MTRLRTPARWVPAALATAAGLWVCVLGSPAHARSGGIAGVSCQGCHGSNGSGQLTLAASPQSFSPGARVELSLSIIGSFAAGGAYIASGGVGDLQVIANQGLTKVSTGLVHNQPKAASGGSVQFRFAWIAPTVPGAVRFAVSALGADGNGRSSGDTGLDGNFDFVFGCTAQTFYLDGDGDGFGRDDVQMVACVDKPPQSYVATEGDCDDFRERAYPGAQEVCNTIDDNCDGRVDENAVPVELWPDADGDGYYDARTEKTGEPKIGCAGMVGWAATPGDCKPKDKSVHAGAEEVCNNVDDDCDGDVDERVRPTCGEGWCRREAPGCDAQYCVPGQPEKEKCNFLDDDCDGLTDEEPDLCPAGQVCAAGSCVDSSTVIVDPTPTQGTAGSASGGSSSAGSASGGSGVVDANGSASCALGTRTGHGSLAVLGALLAARALRRRRRALGSP